MKRFIEGRCRLVWQLSDIGFNTFWFCHLQQSKYISFQAAIQFLDKHLKNFFCMVYIYIAIYTKNTAKIVSSNYSWLFSDHALCWTPLSFEHQQPSMRNLLCTKNAMCSQRLQDFWSTSICKSFLFLSNLLSCKFLESLIGFLEVFDFIIVFTRI